MNKKLIECKVCGKEIAKGAKRCPGCGAKNKKPLFTKWWFWLIIVFMLFSMAGGEEETAPVQADSATVQNNSVESSAEQNTAVQSAQTHYYVGDTLMDGKTKIVFVSSGEYSEDNDYLQPQDGNKYIYLQFAVENTSASDDTHISYYDFEGYADGYSVDMYYGPDDTLSATLSAGRATTGYIYFEVPKNASEIEVEYTLNLFTDEKAKFVYEGEKAFDFVPAANVNATADAYCVGEVAESTQLKISYVSCEQYTSANKYIQAKSGYQFVVCEFEFENLGKSDEYVSSWDFDCYADGMNCDQTYIRDDDLSATISSGRKAKGTVTFEVPVDATVVEVEYLSNYWTSNRVVFTVK